MCIVTSIVQLEDREVRKHSKSFANAMLVMPTSAWLLKSSAAITKKGKVVELL